MSIAQIRFTRLDHKPERCSIADFQPIFPRVDMPSAKQEPSVKQEKYNARIDPIELLGWQARAAGQARMDNPFFRPEHMPRCTGDTFEHWQDKIEAWEIGWQAAELTVDQQHPESFPGH